MCDTYSARPWRAIEIMQEKIMQGKPQARSFPARIDNPKLKKCVRGIVRPRKVVVRELFLACTYPACPHFKKWQEEERTKNALLYGIGVQQPQKGFWGQGEIEQQEEATPNDPTKTDRP